MTAPADTAGIVESWRKAMEGVPPGGWAYSAQKGVPGHCYVAQVFEDDEGPSLLTIDPTPDEDVASRVASWIARCSPPGVSALLDIIEAQAAELAEARAARDEAGRWSAEWHGRMLLAEAARDEALAALRRVAATPNPEQSFGAHLTDEGRAQLAFATIDNVKSIARAALSSAPAPADRDRERELDELVEQVEDAVLTDWFRRTPDPEASRRVVVRSIVRRLVNLGALTSAPAPEDRERELAELCELKKNDRMARP